MEGGIGPALLRISVGIEDIEDLWEDIDQALVSTLLQPRLSAK